MSDVIREMYKRAGLKPPNGKGIHTEKFHSCVIKVTKSSPNVNPYAICMASLGSGKAVRKSHRKKK